MADAMAGAALAAGGSPANEPQDHGFMQDHGYMYGRSFHAPDGHAWEARWMDPAVVEGQG